MIGLRYLFRKMQRKTLGVEKLVRRSGGFYRPRAVFKSGQEFPDQCTDPKAGLQNLSDCQA